MSAPRKSDGSFWGDSRWHQHHESREVARNLEQHGHTVVTADSGETAREILESQIIDMVLLDLRMPGMEGDELLQWMKANEVLREIPVVMVSAVDRMDAVVRCIELGAEDYLPKAFDPVLLRARVQASLSKKRYRDQEQAYLQQIEEANRTHHDMVNRLVPASWAPRVQQGVPSELERLPATLMVAVQLVDACERMTSDPSGDSPRRIADLATRMVQIAEPLGMVLAEFALDRWLWASGLIPGMDVSAADAIRFAQQLRDGIASEHWSDGVPVRARVLVHGGAGLAGFVATPHMQFGLMGDAADAVRALVRGILPGGVLITDSVYRMVRGTMEATPSGEALLPGLLPTPLYVIR
jgi:DNA-binding response OmpR family regulator